MTNGTLFQPKIVYSSWQHHGNDKSDSPYVFYLAGFIESWGRGVEKICNALRAENLPMPEYTVNIMIKFTGPENRIIRVPDIMDRC